MGLGKLYNATTTFVDDIVAQGLKKKPAIYYQDQIITYEDLLQMINRTGNGLKELGVEWENRVMIILPDCPEFVSSFLGAIKIGAVAVPVATTLRPEEYAYLINDSRARVLILHASLLAEIKNVQSQLRFLKQIVVLGGESENEVSFEKMVAGASSHLLTAETGPDDVAFWFYTSGSTGRPKGVVHLHHDMLYCADTVGKHVFAVRPEDITFSVSRLFFAYGLGNSVFFPFRVGASTVLYPDRVTPEGAFEVIARYRPTVFFSVPTFYSRMLQVEDADRRFDLSSVRLFVSSGEMLPPAIFYRWKERFGVELLDVIGSTECLAQFLASRPGKIKPGSCGLEIPGYEVKLRDDDGREVAEGQEGYLWIRGDSTAPFYWNRHEVTKRTMAGDWLFTGDIFRKDQEGYYWYGSRTDDMLKVSGAWVSPLEVENALMEHPEVLEAAVVGAADADGLLKPKAYVALKDRNKASAQFAEELKSFMRERLAPFKCPRWIEFTPELPKTSTGKIQRFHLRSSQPRPKS